MERTTAKVRREELLDLERYERERGRIRERVMGVKSRRRVHLGEHLTFLFENTETIRYDGAYDIRSFEGTRFWSRAKLNYGVRIYYRQSYKNSDARIPVLISLRKDQEGKNTRFMKAHDTE